MLELRPAISEDDYDAPVGLDPQGVVYRRRKARKRALGYDMDHETVPYENVCGITISPQSSTDRVIKGIGLIAIGLAIIVITTFAFMKGVILFGLIIIISPGFIWWGIKAFGAPNGVHIAIDSKGEKKFTITLELDEWRTKQSDIAALLKESGVNVDISLPKPDLT